MAYLKDLTYTHTIISQKLPPKSEIYKICVGIVYRCDEINIASAAHQRGGQFWERYCKMKDSQEKQPRNE